MATILNADTVVGGAIVTADASGQFDFQSAGNKRVFLGIFNGLLNRNYV